MQSNHSQIFISLTLLTFVGFSGWIIANDFSIYVPSSDVVFGSGTEQCDDGNNLDGDGCSSACQNENLCDGSFPDGELDNGEECDDGNGLNTDACDNYCRITICGDRIIQSPNGRGQAEVCDDGNSAVGDGCNSVCTLEIADECGNWVTDGTEDCDDGKRCNNNGDPCYSNADCYGSGTCGTYAGDGCGGSGGTPPEVCDNSTDDDCDGDTDCDDSDCTSHPSCFVGAPASCDYCTACENSYAETWTMTFDASGVTGSCGSADCSNYTGTFYLRMHDQASYSNCNCDGGFCWSDAAMNNDDCNNNGNKWTLTPNVVTDRWELVTGGTSELVTYYKAGGLWDCDGTNILTLDNSNIDPMCSGWPSSVTLTPSASNVTCQSGKTCGNSSVEYDTNTSTYEECDDGNTTSNDGCSNACLLEWWYLPGSEVCDNGTDDDSDSLIDCEDPGCPYGHKCGANGLRCASGSCACPGGTTESNCTDTNDNDCDGSTDCADSDCSADPACGGGGGTPEDCDAAGDEDGDGDENCADSDCPNGTTCGTNGLQCSSGSCTCPGGSTETNCSDSTDNDCDGDTDCADSNCSGLTCGANGRECSGSSCVCTGGGVEVCDSGSDDDCDGNTDCDDSDCSEDPACSGGGESEICDNEYDDDEDGDTDCDDMDCMYDPSCDGGGGGGSEICDNGSDDDGDEMTDCDDDDCMYDPSCDGGGGGGSEICDNYMDDDEDGDWDCDDMDCIGDPYCEGGGSSSSGY